MHHLQLLKQYMESWLGKDKIQFLETLHPDIELVECYGASYRGREEAARWFDVWNSEGAVLSWEIKDVYYDAERETLCATWEFHYSHPDAQEPCFDGITVMTLAEGRIIRLYEYAMKHNRYRPYQKRP